MKNLIASMIGLTVTALLVLLLIAAGYLFIPLLGIEVLGDGIPIIFMLSRLVFGALFCGIVVVLSMLIYEIGTSIINYFERNAQV